MNSSDIFRTLPFKPSTGKTEELAEDFSTTALALLSLIQTQAVALRECRLQIQTLTGYIGWIGLKLGIEGDELQQMLDGSLIDAHQQMEATEHAPDVACELAVNVRAITEMKQPGTGLSN